MHFDLKRPCNDCPFLRDGGIRLTRARVVEIAGSMLDGQGSTFQCHKTVNWNEADDETLTLPPASDRDQHCAGALIFAEKQQTATQMMRIMERLRLYDPAALMADEVAVASVFDSLDDMLATAWRV